MPFKNSAAAVCLLKPQLTVALAMTLLCAPVLAQNAGPLDTPLPNTDVQTPGSGTDTPPIANQEELQEAVEQEQAELEQLDRDTLEAMAENGERAAQVVLGADYAKEASLLEFAPAAANDALSDAAKWYSLAASRGFPGAPSLDQAGVRFYPIRSKR